MKFLTFLVLSGLFFSCDVASSATTAADAPLIIEFDTNTKSASLNKIPDGSNFNIQEPLTGLSINSTNGKLSFDTLANFAAAGGEPIRIIYTDSDGNFQTLQVSLKIKAANKAELGNLIDLFINDSGIGPTGDYNAIDTSQVTDMSSLFYKTDSNDHNIYANFNGDISNWNTSQVTNMGGMFNGADNFNQDISSWDTSKVTDMSKMFASALTFNQSLTDWNTSKVRDMSFMFWQARDFKQNISNWDVAKVTDISSMFLGATTFNNTNSNGAETEPEDYFSVLKNN